MRGKAIKKWVRSGPLRSAYRRLVAACVCPLPFVPHNYPEPERQRRATARLRQFVDTKTFKAMQTSPGSVVRQCFCDSNPRRFESENPASFCQGRREHKANVGGDTYPSGKLIGNKIPEHRPIKSHHQFALES